MMVGSRTGQGPSCEGCSVSLSSASAKLRRSLRNSELRSRQPPLVHGGDWSTGGPSFDAAMYRKYCTTESA